MSVGPYGSSFDNELTNTVDVHHIINICWTSYVAL